jgi:phosphoglycolate phosphatase-like HAD superfamily hydrolase
LRAFPGAQELLQEMRERRLKPAIASSAQPAELAIASLVGIEDLVGEKTSCKDVSRSKPEPDVMQVTLLHTGLDAHVALMIGDTAYDIEAARTAQVRAIALRCGCGGWKDADLAGTLAIYDGPADQLAHYDESPLTG